MNNELVGKFAAWIVRVLDEHDLSPVVAYNFNLYEHEDETAIQLVGATSYDPEDEDWACDTYYSSGEDLFILPHSLTGRDWRDALRFAIHLIEEYFQRSTVPAPLRACRAITVGFVAGDLEIVYSRPDA